MENSLQARHASAQSATSVAVGSHRVLRNTYALLGLTLAFSAGVAALATAMAWPAPGPLLTLAGFFGLYFLTAKLANSAWGLASVFALTGFMGYTLGPLLNRTLALDGGGTVVALALGSTAAVFLALSAWVLSTRRDFSFLGGFLFAGMIVAIVAGLAAYFLQMPGLALAVSAAVALLAAGMILYETSNIIHGGETNYILATVGLYVSIYNLFTSLLSLFGIGRSDE